MDVARLPIGYANPVYAESVSQGGETWSLPRSGGSIVVRRIRGVDHRDAMGPYPLFACSNWSGLGADLAELSERLVSLTIVTDPFGGWDREMLERAFPDRTVPYKEHFIVELSQRTVSRHHERNVTRAQEVVAVESVGDPVSFLDDWSRLYGGLVRRHAIRGVAAFSRESFLRQLSVPGIVVFRALHHGDLIGATLWYAGSEVGYYHLGAYTDSGYRLGASFALFAHALEHFAATGLNRISLGAGAGVFGDPADGLSRFKHGWSNGTRTVYLCGRVLSTRTYSALTRGLAPTQYFPAYRDPVMQ